jgi:hypothetical protein
MARPWNSSIRAWSGPCVFHSRVLRSLPLALLVAACATAGDGSSGGGDEDDSDAMREMGPDGRMGSGNPGDASQFNGTDARESFDPPPDARPATPPPDAPAGCTPTWRSLLANGNLDAGPTAGWSTYSAAGAAVITNGAPLTPHTPPYVAWLAGYDNALEQMWQTVTVPATATMLRFRGYGCFVTTETAAGAFDWATVSLHDPGSMALLEIVLGVTNEDAGDICNFVLVEGTASESYAGRSIDILFEGQNDVSFPTSFWWDTITLEAYACP